MRLLPVLLFGSASLLAHEPEELDPLTITGKAENLIGEAATASQGQSSRQELLDRPFLRRGELLEVVPGLIATQHSGDGKANQYFVRGYNLDHGTDFGLFVDGMPGNHRAHAAGTVGGADHGDGAGLEQGLEVSDAHGMGAGGLGRRRPV